MNQIVSERQLWDARDEIVRQMREGFAGVNDRLDLLNGRVGKNEVELGKHDIRVIGLERRVYARRRTDGSETGENRRVTMRDVQLVGWGGAAVLSVLLFLRYVLPLLQKSL